MERYNSLDGGLICERVKKSDEVFVSDIVPSNWSLTDVAHLMSDVARELEIASNIKTRLQKAYDHLRIVKIPEMMDEQGIKSMNIDDLGRLGLTSDAHVSCPADERTHLHTWLTENGFDDLVSETVNASTLKAWAMKRVKAGEEVPDFLKIQPFSRASITKV